MCLTKLLVMKKEFCMVIAFAMALAGLFTVSYTHLDVYKRQALAR